MVWQRWDGVWMLRMNVPTAAAANSGVNLPCVYVFTMTLMKPLLYSAAADIGVKGRAI